MIRFVHLFNYTAGCSLEEGEAWYLGEHVPPVRRLPGVLRYRSWRAVESPIPYPSAGAPTPFDQFARRSELCFQNLEAGQQALQTNRQLWVPAREGVPGFREFECMFLDEEPQYDLLTDAPPHYTPPPWGSDEPFVDMVSVFAKYKPDVDFLKDSPLIP